MNFLICPDSFKHCASSVEVASIIKNKIEKSGNNTTCVPIADGGEGTVECLLWSFGGEKIEISVRGPLGKDVLCFYGVYEDIAYIEMAQSSGIQYLREEEKNPWITTTYGVGEMIIHALNSGVKKIFMGIGGSATSDGGIGMAQALGAKFFDANGKEISFQQESGYCGGCLEKVESIDMLNFDSRIFDTEIIVLSDVQNPLLGKNGACYTYGPQKRGRSKYGRRFREGNEKFCKDSGIYIFRKPRFSWCWWCRWFRVWFKTFFVKRK